MEYSAFEADFAAIFQKNGLERFCTPQITQTFYQFTVLFLAENAKTNLSAIRSPRDMIAKHYADCLLAEQYLPAGASVLDVGCGGGFPCIPFAIVRPDLQITAIDSTQKKIDFVKKATETLHLSNLQPVCGRIEEKAQAKLRNSFDVVTSRAVAALPVLAELTLPFAKVGGALLALKGAKGREEAAAAQSAIAKLGGKLTADDEKTLVCPAEPQETAPGTELSAWNAELRHLLLVAKEKSTPPEYPRAYAAILKRPL